MSVTADTVDAADAVGERFRGLAARNTFNNIAHERDEFCIG